MKPAAILRGGGIVVLATDTLYGLVGRAEDRKAVERIYELKGRRPDKPLIVLISKVADVERFGVEVEPAAAEQLEKFWPGPVSVILPCLRSDLRYLHRGTDSLAFRLPAKPTLRQLIAQTGPLVAPSANPEGQPPARTIGEARGYFGDSVDFYQAGQTSSQPSRLIKLSGGDITVLRP